MGLPPFYAGLIIGIFAPKNKKGFHPCGGRPLSTGNILKAGVFLK